jgi:hypothetical protein
MSPALENSVQSVTKAEIAERESASRMAFGGPTWIRTCGVYAAGENDTSAPSAD